MKTRRSAIAVSLSSALLFIGPLAWAQPQLPGARPMPAPTLETMTQPGIGPKTIPIEDRAVPPEVENPPAQGMQLRMSGEKSLALPDKADEEQAAKYGGPHGGHKPCPQTITLTAAAPSAASPHSPDFPPTPSAQWIESNFGGTQINRLFRHTFKLGKFCEKKCCELYKGKLEITVKALSNGQNNQSPDAGNDSISIWKNGSVQHWQYIWPNSGVAAGTQQTIVLPIMASWLDGCRLSFQVQDDTAVLSAKLVLAGCCVNPNVKTGQ